MSAAEIIEHIKGLPEDERNAVLRYFNRRTSAESLYDEFTILGQDKEGSDVSFAASAQAEIARHERT